MVQLPQATLQNEQKDCYTACHQNHPNLGVQVHFMLQKSM